MSSFNNKINEKSQTYPVKTVYYCPFSLKYRPEGSQNKYCLIYTTDSKKQTQILNSFVLSNDIFSSLLRLTYRLTAPAIMPPNSKIPVTTHSRLSIAT